MSFKRRDLSVGEKLAILEAYDLLPQMSQREAAVRLGLSQPLLCRLLRNRYDIECASADVSQHRKRRRTGKDGEVEAALKNWYWEQIRLGDPGHLTGDMLKRRAEEIAHNMGKSGFVATNCWFQRWRKRENISTGRSQEDHPSGLEFEGGPAHNSEQQLYQQQQQQPDKQQKEQQFTMKDEVVEELDSETLEGPPNITPSDKSAPSKIQEPSNFDTDGSQRNTTHRPDQPTNPGSPPSGSEMLQALDVLRRGILHNDRPNIQIHYAYEAYIKNVLETCRF